MLAAGCFIGSALIGSRAGRDKVRRGFPAAFRFSKILKAIRS